MKSKNKSGNSALMGIAIGSVIAITISFAFTFLFAICIHNEYFNFDLFAKVQPVIQLLSAFLGCYICGVLVPDRKILNCSIVAVCYYFFLIATGSLFFDGISMYFWVGILTSIAGLVGAILLSTKEKISTKKKRRKKAYC